MSSTRFFFLLFVCMGVIIQGCGTIIQGTTQQMGISSNPSNANVTINGQSKGVTPMIVDLKRKDSHMIRIDLEGYQTYETVLTRKTSGWVWGNIVFGGLIGLVIDATAGGMYKLTPEQIHADFKPMSVQNLSVGDGFIIAIVLEPDPEWEKIEELIPAK